MFTLRFISEDDEQTFEFDSKEKMEIKLKEIEDSHTIYGYNTIAEYGVFEKIELNTVQLLSNNCVDEALRLWSGH